MKIINHVVLFSFILLASLITFKGNKTSVLESLSEAQTEKSYLQSTSNLVEILEEENEGETEKYFSSSPIEISLISKDQKDTIELVSTSKYLSIWKPPQQV